MTAVLAVVILAAAVALAAPPRRRMRVMDALVYGLYRWALWWQCFAVGADKAVLHFRLTRTQTEIRPECGYGVGR